MGVGTVQKIVARGGNVEASKISATTTDFLQMLSKLFFLELLLFKVRQQYFLSCLYRRK